MDKKQEKQKVKYRLNSIFNYVTNLTSIAAIVAVIAMIFVSARYNSALEHYGFIQGDVGKALASFAGTRSALRGAIGYIETDSIQNQNTIYSTKKSNFETYMSDVKSKIDSSEMESLYNDINNNLSAYWTLSDSIIKTGSTSDVGQSNAAQRQEQDELATKYDNIYDGLTSLMSYAVNEGDSLKTQITILEVACIIVVVLIMILARIQSSRSSNKFANGIETILNSTAKRLTELAEGELDNPFPESEYDDEFKGMLDRSKLMADDLNLIISDVVRIMGSMGDGNFMVKSECRDKYVGKFGDLLQAITTLRDRMIETLQQVDTAAQQVYIGSDNLSQSAQALAEGATEQAGAVEELTSTIANLTEDSEKSAKNLEDSHQAAMGYAKQADTSRIQMKELTAAMDKINETSKKIENITADIEDIASQTNLLSLNASIEAARAGEAGKGFAVVADQIRQLAEQSAKSAVDTRELIEGALKEIEQGNSATLNAQESLKLVVDGIESIAETSKSLSSASELQANSMEQAEAGVNQIAEVVQSNSAAAQQTSATSEELSAQAETLRDLVGKFILK
mgnify:FL=1